MWLTSLHPGNLWSQLKRQRMRCVNANGFQKQRSTPEFYAVLITNQQARGRGQSAPSLHFWNTVAGFLWTALSWEKWPQFPYCLHCPLSMCRGGGSVLFMCKCVCLCIVLIQVCMHMKHSKYACWPPGHRESQGKSEGVTAPFSSPWESNLPVICKTQGRGPGLLQKNFRYEPPNSLTLSLTLLGGEKGKERE